MDSAFRTRYSASPIIFCSSDTPNAFCIWAAVPVSCTVRRIAAVGSASTFNPYSRAKAFTSFSAAGSAAKAA